MGTGRPSTHACQPGSYDTEKEQGASFVHGDFRAEGAIGEVGVRCWSTVPGGGTPALEVGSGERGRGGMGEPGPSDRPVLVRAEFVQEVQ